MPGDMKRHGFGLEASHLRHFLRLSRLTLAVCLLYLWLVALADPIPIIAIPNFCLISGG